jgi:protein O-GlcNAc transferase
MIAQTLELAVRHHQAGNLRQAEELYLQILRIDPNHADSWHLLGLIAKQSGRYDVAEEYIRNALRLLPNFAEAHNNLGVTLQEQGKLAEAVIYIQQALRLKPDLAQGYYNLALTYQRQGKILEAISNYQQSLRFQPNNVEAHHHLGNVYLELGQRKEAITSFQEALRLKPDFPEAHHNLGVVLREQGKFEEALSSYRVALHFKPDFAEAYQSLGLTLQDQGKLDQALASFQQALQRKPDYPAALGGHVSQLQQMCLWGDIKNLSQRFIEAVLSTVENALPMQVAPFAFITLGSPPTTAQQQYLCAKKYCAEVVRRNTEPIVTAQTRHESGPIKIGYLSADFQEHATAFLIAELFEKHNRARFQVYAYSYGPDNQGAVRGRLVKSVARFVDIREASSLQAAQKIAVDGIDILVDLKGFTKDGRIGILANRPAPIQVNYLGYPGTVGASFLDYILVDDFIVPMDQQLYFSERLVHLPGCYQVNDSQRSISPTTPSRTDCGLPDAGFIFCSFNHAYKITADLFALWMELLKAIPGSVLWLLQSNRFAPANLRRAAENHGVSGQRIVFAPLRPLAEHLARYRLADLFLDCYPVNGHTTSSDAMWAGCPVLTLVGQTFVSRVSGSLLRAIGLPELITTSFEEYQSLALRLAREPELLASFRARLAEGRKHSRLFDAERFARNLERAYETMWTTYLAGAKPHSFEVEEEPREIPLNGRSA